MAALLENRLLHLLRRRFIEALTLLYFVPLTWGGLVPFDFSAQVEPGGPMHWLRLPDVDVHIPDAVANVALYLPLGILLRVTLLHRGWGSLMSLVGTCLIGGGFSYLTEWSQQFSPTRTASAPDWVCNFAGTLIGAFLGAVLHLTSCAFREVIGAALRRLEYAIVDRLSGVMAGACAAFIFLAAVAPFDVTFSVDRLVQSVRSADLTPFSADARLAGFFRESVVRTPDLADDVAARDRVQLQLDYVWTVCAFMLLAIAVHRYLSAHCRSSRVGAAIWTLVACVMLAAVCSCAQLLIISRRGDVSDLILAASGAAAGIACSHLLVCGWRKSRGRKDATHYPYRRTIVTAMLVGWALFLTARELAPFVPNFSPASIARQLSSAELLPFKSYERAKLPVAVDDLLCKLFGFVALGAIASLRRVLLGADAVNLKAFRFCLQVAAVVALVEAVQIFLPSRTPALTDPMIAGTGVLLGVMGMRLAVVYFQSLQLGRAVLADRVVFNVEFGDALPPPIERVVVAAEPASLSESGAPQPASTGGSPAP